MKTKDKILEILINNQTDYTSGEYLASSLGISRNAIWKAVSALKDDGYNIEGVKNKGYLLINDQDILSRQAIKALLPKELSDLPINIYKELESTNRTAKETAISQVIHGQTIIADAQSQGRAHSGQAYPSPAGGLYMSVILDPGKIPVKEAAHISAYGACCVASAIEELTEKSCSIRLITDIFQNKKKVCGILTESAFDFETEDLQWIVIGIGMSSLAKGRRNQYAAAILSRLLDKNVKKEDILEYYKSHHE